MHVEMGPLMRRQMFHHRVCELLEALTSPGNL